MARVVDLAISREDGSSGGFRFAAPALGKKEKKIDLRILVVKLKQEKTGKRKETKKERKGKEKKKYNSREEHGPKEIKERTSENTKLPLTRMSNFASLDDFHSSSK